MEKYPHKLVTPNKDKFAALHTAFWSGGVFVYVPRGIKVEKPIEIVWLIDSRIRFA